MLVNDTESGVEVAMGDVVGVEVGEAISQVVGKGEQEERAQSEGLVVDVAVESATCSVFKHDTSNGLSF